MKDHSVRNLVLNAVFVALVLLLGLTPIGIIPLGAINVTILHIPVIIGALFLGWKSGLLLGFVFGTCSLMSAMGLTLTPPSGLASALGAANFAYLALMCYIPRLAVPMAAFFLNRLLQRLRVQKQLSLGLSSMAGSLTNSILYLGLMSVFYRLSGLDLEGLAQKLGLQHLSVWGLIGVIFTGAGILEAAAAFVLVPAILTALWKIEKQLGGSKKA